MAQLQGTSVTGSLIVSSSADVVSVVGSGSTANTTLFSIDGNNGRLFEVSDDLSDSLFSVNTIAGLPVLEVFADNRVVAGAYNQNDFIISGSRVGIGTSSPESTLHVSGSSPKISIGRIEAGSNNSGVYDSDHIIVGAGGSISIGAERRGDYALDATTATSTTFRSRVNIWSDNEDHVTFGGASTHIVTAWEDFKIWINNDSATAGVLHLYNKSGKTEFARLHGGGDSWLNGGNVGIGTTAPVVKLDVRGDVSLYAGGQYTDSFTASWRSVFIGTNATIFARDANNLTDFILANNHYVENQSSSPVNVARTDGKAAFLALVNDEFRFFYDSTSRVAGATRTFSESMRILGGNVGIGTTSPLNKLDVRGGRLYISPLGNSASGVDSHALILWNSNDTTFTANALTAYNAHTSWDIDNKATFTASPRANAGSIYTYAGESTAEPVAINRFVQLNSTNTTALNQWTFFQWDGAGTLASDLKQPAKLWSVSTYESSTAVEKLTLSGAGNMYIAGNVGIGTTVPSRTLHLRKDVHNGIGAVISLENSTGGGDNKVAILLTDGTYNSWIKGGRYDSETKSFLSFETTDSEAVRINGDGNVGIGTSTPTYALQVSGSVGITNGANSTLYFINNSNYIGYDSTPSSYWRATGTHYIEGASSYKGAWNTAGNLGVGTTNPGTKLHAVLSNGQGTPSNYAGNVATFQTNNSTGFAAYISVIGGDTGRSGVLFGDKDAMNRGIISYAHTNDRLEFGAAGNFASMVVDSSGNVGIGTTVPTNNLQVVGGVTATSFTGSLLGNASTATSATNADNINITQINDNVTYQVTFTPTNSSGYSNLYIDTDDSHLTYNPSSRTLTSATFVGNLTGNADTATTATNTTNAALVDINNVTTGTGYRVTFADSAGTGYEQMYVHDGGIEYNPGTSTLLLAGDVIAYYNFSDERLKSDIKPLTGSLQAIKQLEGVTYTWKDNPDRGTEVGLIAQQVEQILPEVVREQPRMDQGNFKSVDYEKLTAVLIEAVKEQQAQIDELRGQIKELTR